MPDTDMLQILKPLLAVEHLSSSFSSVTLSHFCFDFYFKFSSFSLQKLGGVA